jgi:hypothetical protein
MRYDFLCALLAGLVAATGANAVSVTNRDKSDHKLTIVEGEQKQDHVLKPTGVLDGVCLKGCVIRLNDSVDDEYDLEGPEIVSIEDGYLYYDGPETTGPAITEPGASAVGQPPTAPVVTPPAAPAAPAPK